MFLIHPKPPVSRVLLTRAPMSNWHLGRNYIDVTAKSGEGQARHFAPSWDLVMGHKRGRLSDDRYTLAYHQQLAGVPEHIWQWLYEQGRKGGGKAVLLCYCPDDVFCHTQLIIAWAVQHYPQLFEASSRQEPQHAGSSGRSLQWRP